MYACIYIYIYIYICIYACVCAIGIDGSSAHHLLGVSGCEIAVPSQDEKWVVTCLPEAEKEGQDRRVALHGLFHRFVMNDDGAMNDEETRAPN